MTNLANAPRKRWPSRPASIWSLACVPLVVIGWLQFSDREPAEPLNPAAHAPRSLVGRGRSIVETSHYEVDTNESGNVVTASAESPESTNGEQGDLDGSDDDEARSLAAIAGEWEDEYQGKRHLTVAGDGTGTMVVDLDGIGKKLFAARLSFDLEWSLADGYVTMKTLGGEPKSKVQLVLKLYGSEAQYKILELTSDRMLLLDADGKTRYDWHRPNSSGVSAK